MPTVKLTKRLIQSATSKPSRYDLCDSELRGLRLRVHPGGRKTFMVYYRIEDGTERRPKIGDFGELTVEQAREIARDHLSKVRAGEDPSKARKDARIAPTVADACERFLEEYSRRYNKPSSVRSNEQRIKLHIVPRLGNCKVANVTREDVLRLHGDMRKKPGAANRTVALISKMFTLCNEWGWHPGPNPARGIKKYPEKKLHRDLSELELARLAKVLRDAESGSDPATSENPRAVEAIRLLMFTGCRRGEVLGLRWDEVDLKRRVLHLSDSKSGAKTIWLNSAAIEILSSQEPMVGNPYVFPSSRTPGKPLHDLNGPWYRMRKRAGLDGVRLHDLRHNLASWAAADGQSLVMIGRLLGHKVPATTARYADLADRPAQRAAEQVGQALSRAMAGGKDEK